MGLSGLREERRVGKGRPWAGAGKKGGGGEGPCEGEGRLQTSCQVEGWASGGGETPSDSAAAKQVGGRTESGCADPPVRMSLCPACLPISDPSHLPPGTRRQR